MILSIRYCKYVGSLLVGIRSRLVMLQVVGVAKYCWRLKCLRILYESESESDLTQTQDSCVNNKQTNL